MVQDLENQGNIQRLGYFEEVQAIRSRDKKNPSILNYEVSVKEKPTGQLQAAVGYSPNSNTSESQFSAKVDTLKITKAVTAGEQT